MKKNNAAGAAGGDFRQLIREVLGLEPASLAAIDTQYGLNTFLRLTLERAVDALGAKDGTVIRLRTDASARALGWGDARIHALSSLIVWALIQAPRRARGLPYVALCPAQSDVVELSPRPDTGKLWSAEEAVAVATALMKEGVGAMRDAPELGALQPMPICPLVEDLLGLEPAIIVRAWYETRSNADDAFARDAEGQTAAALATWMISILDLYQVVAQQIDTIRLLIGNDSIYRGPANARYANIGTLLLGGLLAEGDRHISFLVPKAA